MGPKGFVEGEDNHHVWIGRQRRLLDFFAAGKSSSFKSERAGLVFVGPDPPRSGYHQDAILHLNEHDDSMRALYQKLIDVEGWKAVLNEQIDENAASIKDNSLREATDMRLKEELNDLNHRESLIDQKLVPGMNGLTGATYKLSGFDGYFAHDPLWIEVEQIMPGGGRIFLYAVCNDGLQSIDELYVGVPTIVEVQYDPPLDKPEVSLEIQTSSGKLTLTAKRYDPRGYIFRSEPILLQGEKDTGPVFNPAPPPKQ